jgi:hypothetical protein
LSLPLAIKYLATSAGIQGYERSGSASFCELAALAHIDITRQIPTMRLSAGFPLRLRLLHAPGNKNMFLVFVPCAFFGACPPAPMSLPLLPHRDILEFDRLLKVDFSAYSTRFKGVPSTVTSFFRGL